MTDARIASLTGERDRRGSVLVGLAASAILHLLVLTALAFRWLEGDIPPRPAPTDRPILIEIEPRPLFSGETARVPTASPASPLVEARPRTGAAAVAARPDEEDDAPTSPLPRSAGAPPGASGPASAEPNPWALSPESIDAAVARSLRLSPVGCRTLGRRLTAAEQAYCDEQFNNAPVRAGPIGPRTQTPAEARRDAQFAREGELALRRYEAQRAPLASGVGVVGPADCVGSNLGVGCAGAHLDPSMRQGATTNIRQPGNKVD